MKTVIEIASALAKVQQLNSLFTALKLFNNAEGKEELNVQVQIINPGSQHAAVLPMRYVVEGLQEAFEKLGNELEAAGIDMTTHTMNLEAEVERQLAAQQIQ